MPKISTEVLANNEAPIRHTSNIDVLIRVQNKKRHHNPSGKKPASPEKQPPGPKLFIMPSTQPEMAIAQPTTFAKKNSVPMEPPNSRPKVRLIITVVGGNVFNYLVWFKKVYIETLCNLQYTPPPSIAPFVEIAQTEATVNSNMMQAITNCKSVTYKPALPTMKPVQITKKSFKCFCLIKVVL